MGYTFEASGRTTEIAGYLLIQPIGFTPAGLVQDRRNARLAVQLAMSGWNESRYPSETTNLRESGTVRIRDGVGSTVVNGSELQWAGAIATQTTDLAGTTWIFEGGKESEIRFTPGEERRSTMILHDASEHYYPWRGRCVVRGGPTLHLSYLGLELSPGENLDVRRVDVLGHANVNGVRSVLDWILTQPQNEWWPEIEIRDVSRGTTTGIAGRDAEGREQLTGATGAAFALNGVFANAPVPALMRLARRLAPSPDGAMAPGKARHVAEAARDAMDVFEDLAQRCTETLASSKRSPGDHVVAGHDFEGFTLQGLSPLERGRGAALL